MVNQAKWRGQVIYECELCGSGYGDLETAERCEQYCYLHRKPSPTLMQKSLRKTTVRVDRIETNRSLVSGD